jgi:hypothetical protein
LRWRKAAGEVSGDKDAIDDQAERAMCCQIPPYRDFRPDQTKSTDDNNQVTQSGARFFAGVVLLSASMASAAWLAFRLA